MSVAVYQPSVSQATMQKAEKIAEMLATFPTGRCKQTGIVFTIIPSSDNPAQTGHTATALQCSCLGWRRNSICSHQLACQIVLQRQTAERIAAAAQKRRENGRCTAIGCIRTAEKNALNICADHAQVLRISVEQPERRAAARARVLSEVSA